MPQFEYRGEELSVRVANPTPDGGVSLHIEHATGAALIVPSTPQSRTDDGAFVTVTGFDGNLFQIRISEERVFIQAEQASPILGGGREADAERRRDLEKNDGPIRVTGDESTMPIDVD